MQFSILSCTGCTLQKSLGCFNPPVVVSVLFQRTMLIETETMGRYSIHADKDILDSAGDFDQQSLKMRHLKHAHLTVVHL